MAGLRLSGRRGAADAQAGDTAKTEWRRGKWQSGAITFPRVSSRYCALHRARNPSVQFMPLSQRRTRGKSGARAGVADGGGVGVGNGEGTSAGVVATSGKVPTDEAVADAGGGEVTRDVTGGRASIGVFSHRR